MQRFIVFLVFISYWSVGASHVDLVSLYSGSALVTDRLLPFRIIGSEGLEIVSLSAVPGCHTQVDKFRKDIILLYCQGIPANASQQHYDVSLTVGFNAGGNFQQVRVSGIRVSQLSVIVKTPEEPVEPIGPTPFEKGRALYNQYCTQCHNSALPIPAGQTLSKLRAAFNRPSMIGQNFNSVLSDEQVDNLVKYFNGEE